MTIARNTVELRASVNVCIRINRRAQKYCSWCQFHTWQENGCILYGRKLSRVGKRLPQCIQDFGPDEIRAEYCDSIDDLAAYTGRSIDLPWDDLLNSLTTREEEVLRLYYGLGRRADDDPADAELSPYDTPHTLREIGRMKGCTGANIRRIKMRALKKLKARIKDPVALTRWPKSEEE